MGQKCVNEVIPT